MTAGEVPRPFPRRDQRAGTGALAAYVRTCPASVFHLRFPDDCFFFDEPPPADLKLVPRSRNRRQTRHETWRLPARPDLACDFGGEQAGRCSVCDGPLHNLITLPGLEEPAFRAIGPLRLASLLVLPRVNRLGGRPNWIQDPEMLSLPQTNGLPATARQSLPCVDVDDLRRGGVDRDLWLEPTARDGHPAVASAPAGSEAGLRSAGQPGRLR